MGVEACLVAAGTLSLIIVRPKGLNEGVAALGGGLLVLVLGLVPLRQALVGVELANWNVFLFFLGMMGIAALADQSGVFDLIADTTARLARGRVLALYIAVFLLGAVISLLFANDSAALVLTPIVYTLVVRLSLDPIPFVFATTFVADTASVGLPVSNPLNVIVSDGFGLGLGEYVGHLWLPSLLVIAINLAVFLLLYRRKITGRYQPLSARVAKPGLTSSIAILLLVAAAYLVASALRLSLGIIAVSGAVVLGVNLLRVRALDTQRLRRDIGWPIFGFIAGMFLVVRGLDDTGVTAALGATLARTTGGTHLSAIGVTTVGTAIGANLINNLPMALVMVSTVPKVQVAHGLRPDLTYATILGCDLGPNLTHLGSLATFIWLFFLRRKGVEVSAWDYFRVGVIVTPLMLVGAVLGLWITSGGVR